ncbi:Tyrosyl-tRNA synthetase [Hordeum vulgare]|nr:Tyrosyl-tRNA synthetase [Hordeum vulgare]
MDRQSTSTSVYNYNDEFDAMKKTIDAKMDAHLEELKALINNGMSISREASQAKVRDFHELLRLDIDFENPFYGTHDPEEYLEWERKMDTYLKLLQVPSEGQVKCATRNFHDYASTWWLHTPSKSFEMSWSKTKKVMWQEFVPSTYMEHLQRQLENTIQGSKPLDEYFMEMKKALRQVGVADPIWMKFHFMMGLNNDIAKTIFTNTYKSLMTSTLVLSRRNKNSRPRLLDRGTTMTMTMESLKEHALEAGKDDVSIFGGESDNVSSSAFINSDGDDMVDHGIFPSTTVAFGDELRDFCHHIKSESDFTTSPIYDELPHFPCDESHKPHHLSEMSDSTICENECNYLEGVSEPPPHRESEVVDTACEAILISNNLTSTTIVSSPLVQGPIYDDAPILDDFVLPLEKTMAMVEYDAPPHGSITMKMSMIWSLPSHLHHMSGMKKVK